MNTLEIKLQTLTPIWTGGIEGRADRLHSTGIVGGLRWWYEAIVRGLGGEACDPSTHACNFDNTAYEKARHAGKSREEALGEAGLCDACQMFGATGWRRQFRLEVAAQDDLAWEQNAGGLNIKPYGRTRGWFLNPGRVGSLLVTSTGNTKALRQIVTVFRFLEAWGSIGARPQLGYGVFKIKEVKFNVGELQKEENHFAFEPLGNRKIADVPDLRTFTFFKLRFFPTSNDWWTQIPGIRELRSRREVWRILESLANRGMVPVSPALKNHLRYGRNWSPTLAQWLFGTLRHDERLRSKISLSWAYQTNGDWEIRGWVYVPRDKVGQSAYNEVASSLRSALEHPQFWFQALGIEEGYRYQSEVIMRPSPSPWQVHTIQEIVAFLKSTIEEGIR